MLLQWIQGCGRQNDPSQHIGDVGKMGGGFLRITIEYCCLQTKFLSIGLLLPRLNLQGGNMFLISEIGLDLIGSEIGLVFLLAKEDAAALVIQPLYYT